MRLRLLFWPLILSACGSGYTERPTQVGFDPAANDFWAKPFPSDLRRQADGSYDLERWPAYGANSPLARTNTLLGDWLLTLDERVKDGFSVSGGGYFALSGPIDPASLPGDAAASLAPGASAFLIDLGEDSPNRGQRLPIVASLRTEGDRYSPPNLLALVPPFGILKREKTRYAFVITDGVRDAAGEPLGRSRPFHDAFTDSGDADPAVVEHLRPLREALEDQGVELSSIVGATVFTTLDPVKKLYDLARWAETLPAPSLAGPWRVKETYPDYQVLTSTFTVPRIQSGPQPYKVHGEGQIVYGPDGQPQIQSMQAVRLVLSIPRRPQPAAGFPLMMYLHGSGGEWYEGIDRSPLPAQKDRPPFVKGEGPAKWLARRGIAMVGFDFPIHGNRHNPPDTTGLVFYNLFGNIDATIDNFHVAVMETTILSRLLLSLRIDPALAPTLDPGSQADLHFDPERLVGMGHSMGQSLGIPWASVDPRVKAFFVSGGGGMLPEVAVNAQEPITLRPFVEGSVELPEGQHLDVDHPLLHALQTLWDYVDPVVKAPHLARDPLPGIPAKHVLMTAGVRDGYFAPGAQAALATALGLPLVGPSVEPTLPERLALGGLSAVEYPVQGNLPNGITGAVIHYEVPLNLGHYVSFDLESARYQYTCFLATVGPQGAPTIASAQGLDAPCP